MFDLNLFLLDLLYCRLSTKVEFLEALQIFIMDEGVSKAMCVVFCFSQLDLTSFHDPDSVLCLTIYVSGAKISYIERQLLLAINTVTALWNSRGFKFYAVKTKAMLF